MSKLRWNCSMLGSRLASWQTASDSMRKFGRTTNEDKMRKKKRWNVSLRLKTASWRIRFLSCKWRGRTWSRLIKAFQSSWKEWPVFRVQWRERMMRKINARGKRKKLRGQKRSGRPKLNWNKRSRKRKKSWTKEKWLRKRLQSKRKKRKKKFKRKNLR